MAATPVQKSVGVTAGTIAAGDDPRIVAGANAAALTGKVIVATGTGFREGVAADIPDLSSYYIPTAGNASAATTTGSRTGETARAFNIRLIGTADAGDFGAVGDGSTDDTTAIQKAINHALTRKCKVVIPSGTYKITTALDCRPTSGDNFAGIEGDGVEKTIIKQSATNTPIMRVWGRYQSYEQFSLSYATQAPLTDTSSIALQLEDQVYFNSFRNLLISGGYKGIGSVEGSDSSNLAMVFSCTFDCMRFLNHQYAAISMGGAAGGGATQNNWGNIYCSNANLPSVFRMVELLSKPDETFNVLNLEQSSVRDAAFANLNGDNVTINGLHMEGIKLFGSGTNGSETYNGSLIYSSNRGAMTIRGVGIFYPFIGPLMVTSLTRTSTTATMTVNNLDHIASVASGHGIRAGDVFTIRGANDSAWNTTFTATSVTLTTVVFTCAGTETTPGIPVSTNDYITANLGNSAMTASAIVKTVGNADTITLDGVKCRSAIVTGASSGDRGTMFRICQEANLNGSRVRVRDLCVQGLPNLAQYLQDGAIVAMSRVSNVATAYTSMPHRLRINDTIRINASTDTTYNGTKSVLAIVDDYTFTFSSTGSDTAIARQGSSRIVLATAQTTFRARSANVATLTTSAAHGFRVGQRLRVDNMSGTGYIDSETVIQSIPTTTTLTYMNSGSDEASTADAGGIIMLLDAGLSATNYSTPSNSAALKDADWLYKGQAALDFGGAIAAGSAGTQAVTFTGCFLGDRVEFTPRTAFNDGLIVTAAVLANGTITFRAFNATTGSITPALTITRFSLERN